MFVNFNEIWENPFPWSVQGALRFVSHCVVGLQNGLLLKMLWLWRVKWCWRLVDLSTGVIIPTVILFLIFFLCMHILYANIKRKKYKVSYTVLLVFYGLFFLSTRKYPQRLHIAHSSLATNNMLVWSWKYKLKKWHNIFVLTFNYHFLMRYLFCFLVHFFYGISCLI